MPLNVVSALTRLGVDPWDEAARLSALPKSLAAEALERMIARLPVFQQQQSDNMVTSQRLVELLPAGQQTAAPCRKHNGATDKRNFQTMMLVACLGLGAAALYAML